MRTATAPDLKHHVCAAVDALATDLVALSHDLHDHPEVAWHEVRSSRAVAASLAARGLPVQLPAHGLPTALRAHAGTRGPLVVLCAEYDALPGLGHGCGHNVIAAAAVGAAVALAPLAEGAGGRVTLLGTPAEEGGGGKIVLLGRGAFDGAAAVLLVHPGREDTVDAAFRAAAGVDLTFHGRAAHAAMAAHEGRNALDAALLAHQATAAVRGPVGSHLSAVLPEGGQAPNVVPDRATLRVMVRARTSAELAPLLARVRTAADGAALATGCRVEVRPRGPVYRELRGDAELARLFSANATRLGRRMRRADPAAVLTAGSTDLGNVSHVVPTVHPKLAISRHPQHSAAFARDARSPAADLAVLDGAKALAMTTLDIWKTTVRSTPWP